MCAQWELTVLLRSHGAEVVDPHEHGGKEEKAKAFEGTGFRLGTAIGPSMPDPATVKKPAAVRISIVMSNDA